MLIWWVKQRVEDDFMEDYKAKYPDFIKVIRVKNHGECYIAMEADKLINSILSERNDAEYENDKLKMRIKELENQLNENLKKEDDVCIKKEDALRGSKVKKLNSAERKEVYEMFKSGVSYSRISGKFSITRNTIKAYVREFEGVSENVKKRILTDGKKKEGLIPSSFEPDEFDKNLMIEFYKDGLSVSEIVEDFKESRKPIKEEVILQILSEAGLLKKEKNHGLKRSSIFS